LNIYGVEGGSFGGKGVSVGYFVFPRC